MARHRITISCDFFFLSRILFTKACNNLFIKKKPSTTTPTTYTPNLEFQKQNPFFANYRQEECEKNQTLMFHVEGALLKSSSIFPYFMLVAFEAGSIIRALVLLLLYPLILLVGEDMGLKIMTFVSLVGVRVDSFRAGRVVLPKFFLDDVGFEGYNMVMRFGKKIGVTDMPRVMVDVFLRHYLGIEDVVGRELKVVSGYFVGLMEPKKSSEVIVREILGEETMKNGVFGFGNCFNKPIDHQCSSVFKGIYMVSETEKKTWRILPREKYSKPLIFHDGRLAFMPTPLATLAMFMWIPLGIILLFIRANLALLLPYKVSLPILACIGMTGSTSLNPNSLNPNPNQQKIKGTLYVCNHRTLFDPIFLSFALLKPLTAVTYSLSKASALFAPIRTVPLSRNRDKDSILIEKLLRQGDLVVCPEGTTCREPYLLRFSPLFAEISDNIVPVAITTQVNMFYATTAGGFKFLDPVFMLMNPTVNTKVKILEKVPENLTCQLGGKSRFEVANYVQAEIGKALGFECTSLTRKDKYIYLADNEGKV